MITWPITLPRPMRAGYATTLPDGRRSTAPEMGPPHVRRRYSAAVATVQMVIDVSLDERARFWRFWETDTVSGSLPWACPDWTIDGVALLDADADPLAEDDGVALEIAAVRLVMFGTEQPPSETPIGNRWRVTFRLTVLP